MKTTLLSLAFILFVSPCALTADSSVTGTSQFSLVAQVVAKKQTVRLGDPIIVSVTVSNQASQVKEVDLNVTEWGSFLVTDPDGKALPYVGPLYQISVNKAAAQPHSTVTIKDEMDLTDKYLFQKTGRYSIQLRGDRISFSNSPAIVIEVTAGRLSERDDVFVSLLPVCPNGWSLLKGIHGVIEPFGRGFGIDFICHPMQKENVDLWFTKEEVKVDPNRQPRFSMEYLGYARGLFVYGSVGENTPVLWPTAIEDISRALGITKQTTSLTAEQAKTLAMKLANDKVSTLYHSQPFVTGQPPQFVTGRWVWVARQGFGSGDIQARVELAADGSTNSVDVQVFDSRSIIR